MESQYSTVLWRDLDFIRHLDPAIKVSHRTKQGVKFFAELTITSVDGIDAEGGSKSDHQSDNKIDITGFLLDNSPASCEERDGVIDLVFEPLFKEKSFGHWVKMEVKVTEDTNCQYYPVGEVWIGHEYENQPLQNIA
ncbi:Cell pattern formation-associated protein STUA [Fusarium oxysporum f. sp. albedinis]|nr:Cell pattern formation-associated protein STUA [Fusarium oxysporum f. sp. albedinis]